ncbi:MULTISPECIES: hypothetical protein [Pseudomonas]|uniref:hypothetical protein n=1 Tax=Pseudomonas TaxID=286 RepID=UPI003002BA2F
MAKVTIEAKLTYAWWWPFYKFGVGVITYIMQRDIDEHQFKKWHDRACTVEMIGVKR